MTTSPRTCISCASRRGERWPALHIFQALLPPRRARKMKKQLKRIRRAAGDARDLDVLAARLKKITLLTAATGGAKLRHFITHLRHHAQPAIEKLHAHLCDKHRFARREQALVARVRVRSADGSTESHTFAGLHGKA